MAKKNPGRTFKNPQNWDLSQDLATLTVLLVNSVTRYSDKKITSILLKIAKFVATVNKQVFKMPKYLHQSFYELAILGKKIVAKGLQKSPKWQKIAKSGHTVS